MKLPGTLDIGDVSVRSGLPASTLRYYEEKGLIRSVGRKGLRRLFDANVMDRLSLITLARKADFSLQEIAALIGEEAKPTIDRTRLLDKAEEIERTIKQLTVMQRGLEHMAKCPAENHLDCPTFRRIMRWAGRG